jgi:hypothetical protein
MGVQHAGKLDDPALRADGGRKLLEQAGDDVVQPSWTTC